MSLLHLIQNNVIKAKNAKKRDIEAAANGTNTALGRIDVDEKQSQQLVKQRQQLLKLLSEQQKELESIDKNGNLLENVDKFLEKFRSSNVKRKIFRMI